jgi:dephospho-CoA kinase
MTIGITGRYCAGKSIASEVFKKNGYTVIDVDSVGHEALEVKKAEILRFFGADVQTAGRIDRKKLGDRVFNHADDKKRLESIVHPWMVGRVEALVKKQPKTVINAALLIEMGLYKICDFVVAIDISDDIAVERGMLRDRLTRDEAIKRIKAQISLKEKLEFVDKVIDNNGNIENFKKSIDRIIKTIGSKV